MIEIKINFEIEELVSLILTLEDKDFEEIFDSLLISKIESRARDSIEATNIYNTIISMLK